MTSASSSNEYDKEESKEPDYDEGEEDQLEDQEYKRHFEKSKLV
jgi:hypothetical protein